MIQPSVITPPQFPEVPPYVWYGALFSPPECAALIAFGEVAEPGKIGNGIANQTVVDPTYRQVMATTITEAMAPWAYARLRDKVVATNTDYFRYDLVGFQEQLILLRYDADPVSPGKYRWHQDIGGGMSSLRKLSTVTQLSDPADYAGGRLHLFTNGDFDPGHVAQGDTVLFPSYLPHCVTPMERGRRYSLVAWVTGPSWR